MASRLQAENEAAEAGIPETLWPRGDSSWSPVFVSAVLETSDQRSNILKQKTEVPQKTFFLQALACRAYFGGV